MGNQICSSTGKLCLSKRNAGTIINLAKKNNHSKTIPKSFYFCRDCGNFHTTHYGVCHENHSKRK